MLFLKFIAKLAIYTLPILVLVMMQGVKYKNTPATLCFFVSALCTIPLFYALRRFGGIWQNLNNIEVLGFTHNQYILIEIVFFAFGLLFLCIIKPKPDPNIEFTRLVAIHKAQNDAEKKKDTENNQQ